MERFDFNFIFFEHDEGENSENSSETPRRSKSTHANYDGSNKCISSPKIIIDVPVTATRKQSLHILCCSEKDAATEVKCKRRLLSRKHHPDECCVSCDFVRITRESTLKNILNAHELLSRR